MNLTEFLLARIAEDEASALEFQRHMYLPTRALAEVEAKRGIAAEHDPFLHMKCGDWTVNLRQGAPYCPTLRFLALPYADHPDYREEWS